jgi:hypothetical protein
MLDFRLYILEQKKIAEIDDDEVSIDFPIKHRRYDTDKEAQEKLFIKWVHKFKD